tara:strand:- start:69462 stop:70517 length:1056 start_codon:yes stop_codon:yes gene_type:complete
MKYHDIPSLKLLQAYKQGKLSGHDLNWVEERIANNPMVAGVVDQMDVSDYNVVQSITDRVRHNVVEKHLSKTGFWTKYGVWIGLSSIAILLGIVGFTSWNSPEPRYFNETMLLSDPDIDVDAWVKLAERDETQNGQQDDVEINVVQSENDLGNQDQLNTKQSEERTLEKKGKELDAETKEKFTVQTNNEDEGLNKNEQNYEDNTREFDNEQSKNQTILLAVSTVQILSKTNPDALNTRTTGGGGNPLGDQTTSSGSSFSVKDIPAYPGGDRALGNYFKGKLRPIQIPQHQDKFDRTVLIELTINARGKLKDYKIRGQLHPTHQQALEKAIEELPRFRKGSEKITYSLGVSF